MTQHWSFPSMLWGHFAAPPSVNSPTFKSISWNRAFGTFSSGSEFPETRNLPVTLQKIAQSFSRRWSNTHVKGRTPARSAEESRKTMRARPEVRDILIALKLRYWSLRARYPSAYPNCSPSRARRNFLRLLARHPEIARRLNLHLRDAYPPV